MELPHFHVLHGEARAERHARTVAGVHEGVGRGGVDPPCPARGKHHGLGTDVDRFPGFDADGHDAGDGSVLVLHQVHGEPLGKEGRVGLQILLVKGVQQGVARAVRGGAGPGCLPALAVVLGLAAEGALIDAARLRAREWQAHVLELEHGLGSHGTHVLNGVLVPDVIGALDRVIHMPAPIIIGVIAGNGAGDATLGRHGVGTGWEDLRDAGRVQAALRQLKGRAHPRAATANDDGIKGHGTEFGHGL